MRRKSQILTTLWRPSLREKNRVSLAEASLIKYFEPEYNKIYKTTFPSPKHKVLEELLRLDFSGLVVEINTENIKAKLIVDRPRFENDLFSKLHPYVHVVNIPLYSAAERESFLHHYL
jgi:hypothetical protein